MSIRTSKPEAGNKYFITRGKGGYSGCIIGSPTDSGCNVLANCVGYANGAINEEKAAGKEVYPLTCNAENFIERGIAYGLSVYKNPEVGDCLVWQKGATLKGSDGAGHVAICIEVLERNTDGTSKKIRTAESGYGSSKVFWTTTRTNVNGQWGAGAGYKYRGSLRIPGFNINPTPTPEPTPAPTPAPDSDANKWPKFHTVKAGDTLSGIALKYYGNGDSTHYNYIAKANNISDPNIIVNGKTLTIPEYKPDTDPTPKPTSNELKVGDNVQITAIGRASSYGTGAIAGGIGWKRQIIRIHPGRPYPYQVGNSTGTTGFYKKAALKKLS